MVALFRPFSTRVGVQEAALRTGMAEYRSGARR
jgi:hypothetical protein